MADWSPPEIPRALVLGVGLLWVLWLLYCLLVVQQVLLGILPGVLLGLFYVVRGFLGP